MSSHRTIEPKFIELTSATIKERPLLINVNAIDLVYSKNKLLDGRIQERTYISLNSAPQEELVVTEDLNYVRAHLDLSL